MYLAKNSVDIIIIMVIMTKVVFLMSLTVSKTVQRIRMTTTILVLDINQQYIS